MAKIRINTKAILIYYITQYEQCKAHEIIIKHGKWKSAAKRAAVIFGWSRAWIRIRGLYDNMNQSSLIIINRTHTHTFSTARRKFEWKCVCVWLSAIGIGKYSVDVILNNFRLKNEHRMGLRHRHALAGHSLSLELSWHCSICVEHSTVGGRAEPFGLCRESTFANGRKWKEIPFVTSDILSAVEEFNG